MSEDKNVLIPVITVVLAIILGFAFLTYVKPQPPGPTPGDNVTPQPQPPTPSPKTTTLRELFSYSPGLSYKYRLNTQTAYGTQMLDITYLVKDLETFNGTKVWAMEMQVEASGTNFSIREWRDEKTQKCIKQAVTIKTQEGEVEQAVPCLQQADILDGKLELLHTESITVPAGTYSSDFYSSQDNKTQCWKVNGMHVPVKIVMINTQNSTLELVSYTEN